MNVIILVKSNMSVDANSFNVRKKGYELENGSSWIIIFDSDYYF